MEYLYHYTSIDSLALILKNRTIRFNSLDHMDDKQESLTGDIKNIGQFCYISSWTSDATESIPMWKMYTNTTSGVRIKLPKNPFYKYVYSRDELEHLKSQLPISGIETDSLTLYQPIQELLASNFLTYSAYTGAELYEVEYTTDKEKLYPTIMSMDSIKGVTLELGKIGKYKNVHWKFQKEWRYKWFFLPFGITPDSNKMLEKVQLEIPKLISGIAKQPFKYYDNKISDEAFLQMEITLSPSISSGNEELIRNTIQKYNPTAQIKNSSLLGLL